MPDFNGYPLEEELKFIEEYDVIKNGPIGLIDHLKEIWHWDDYISFDEKTGILELHTGGWSGNEILIQVLEKTFFWYFYWIENKRGGHYKFLIPKRFYENNMNEWYEDK